MLECVSSGHAKSREFERIELPPQPGGPISEAEFIKVPYKEDASGDSGVLCGTIRGVILDDLGCYSARGTTEDFSEKCVRFLKMSTSL